MQKKLTKSNVEQLTKPGYCSDTELKGFRLRIVCGTSGKITRTYMVNGKPKGRNKNITVTIGKHGVISADNARAEAKRILGLMAQGINPTPQKNKKLKLQKAAEDAIKSDDELAGLTLEALIANYLETHPLKEKTKTDYVRFTKRCVGDWLKLPVTKITRDMIQKRHLEISKEHPAQANYTMRILRALFKYAGAVYEDSEGKPLIGINPVDRLKHARLWNAVPRRQTLIRPHQLKDWYKAVSELSNLEARDLLLLEIFTGLRHGEAISMEWRNVDFEAKTITIEDTKNHSDLMLPMSTFLHALFQERLVISGEKKFVFPSPLRDHRHSAEIRDPLHEVVQKSGIQFTEHDLRRTFETTAESLDISYYTLKRLLNHKTGADPTAGYIVTSAERMREASQKIAECLAASMGMHKPAPVKNQKKHLRMVR